MRIMIDPGHGGNDPGAVLGSRYEKNDVLNLAMKVGGKLSGTMEVLYTRTDDTFTSPGGKAAIGNQSGADYFCSIHRNAGNPAANGVEVIVYDTAGVNYRIASKICEKLAALGFHNRGVKVNPSLAVLNGTNMPALLVEAGFITSTSDNALFDARFEAVAGAIAAAYQECLGLAPAQPTQPPSAQGTSVEYRAHVQDTGWQDWVSNGSIAGSVGESRRLEALEIKCGGLPEGAYVEGQAHIQDIGWTQWYTNGLRLDVGTEGQALRLEAVKLRLASAPGYRIRYSVHVQDIGWMDWCADGAVSGTEGQARRIEAIRIVVEKV